MTNVETTASERSVLVEIDETEVERLEQLAWDPSTRRNSHGIPEPVLGKLDSTY